MSRQDYSPALAAMLDRFEVPAPSSGLGARIAAAARHPALPPRAMPRISGRRLWKRGRQIVIGTVAFGMLSAAAVASGLLGAAGIEVPVLSAMLAPRPAAKPRLAAVPRPKPPPAAPAPAPKLTSPPAVEDAVVTAAPAPTERDMAFAKRLERIAERRAFLGRYPGLKEAMLAGPEARKRYIDDHPEIRPVLRARQQAKRAALGLLPLAPKADGIDPDASDARRQAWRERRATLIEMRRLQREQRAPIHPDEGNPAPAR